MLGLNSLFTDLLNFDDPLNLEAAQHYERDKVWQLSCDYDFFYTMYFPGFL